MGQTVDFWNDLIPCLRMNGIFDDECDRFWILPIKSGGTGLRLRFENERPQVDEFEDWEDFNMHPLFEFQRKVRRTLTLAKKEMDVELKVGRIYTLLREFEVFFY